MAGAEYGLADLIAEMQRVTAATKDPAAIVTRLAEPARRLSLATAWLEQRFFAAPTEQPFAIYSLHEESDHSLSVVVASLLPGQALPPHNHRVWALQAGIRGLETNVMWRRTDDGTRRGYAALEEKSRSQFGPGEVLTFAPDDIHSILNESDALVLSLNLYGLSYPYTGASKFDPVAHTEAPLIPK